MIKFFDRYMNRPIHFFGGVGFFSLFLGGLFGVVSIVFKFSFIVILIVVFLLEYLNALLIIFLIASLISPSSSVQKTAFFGKTLLIEIFVFNFSSLNSFKIVSTISI